MRKFRLLFSGHASHAGTAAHEFVDVGIVVRRNELRELLRYPPVTRVYGDVQAGPVLVGTGHALRGIERAQGLCRAAAVAGFMERDGKALAGVLVVAEDGKELLQLACDGARVPAAQGQRGAKWPVAAPQTR